jgi:hypothetical protein
MVECWRSLCGVPPYLRPAVEPFLRQEIAKVKGRLDDEGPFDSVSKRRRAHLREEPPIFPRPPAGASRFGG